MGQYVLEPKKLTGQYLGGGLYNGSYFYEKFLNVLNEFTILK